MRTIYERKESERLSALKVMENDRDDEIMIIHEMATASGHMYDVIELSESEVRVLADVLVRFCKESGGYE